MNHVVGKNLSGKALGIISRSLEHGGLLFRILQDIAQRICAIAEVIVIDNTVTTYFTGFSAIFAEDQSTTALGVQYLVIVTHTVGGGDDDSLSHLSHGSEVGMMHLVHLFETVEHVKVMSLLLNDVLLMELEEPLGTT